MLVCEHGGLFASHVPHAHRHDHTERRIEGSNQCVEPDAVVARRGTTMRDGRGALHARDVDQLAGDQRPCERGRHRRAIAVERPCLQRRKRVIADELIAHVDHVDAYGPERQRTLTDLDELAAVANVERNGDDLGLEGLRQPRDRDGWVEPTRIGKNYAVQRLQVQRIERKRSAIAVASVAERQITRIVSSPPMVPAISARRARSMA